MNQNEFLDFLARAVDTNRQDCFENFKEKEIVYQIKTSDEKTRQCFYLATESSSSRKYPAGIMSDFAELAVKYACYGLKMTPAHGFSDTVQNCSYSIIGDWFKTHSELGSDILSSYLIAEIALRILNILVLAFAVVILGFDVAEDFEIDRSAAIKTMDILNITLTGAACILEGVSLGLDLAGVVCDAIPVIGAVCMVLGFVFSIVSMILKAKDQPEPPVITFIKD